jgi:hypothetical protein
MQEVKAVVGGSRYQQNRNFVFRAMDTLRKELGITSVAQGGARGTDELIKVWAESRGVPCRTYEANWDKHGKAAGPIRNSEMLEAEQPDYVVGFPGGRGTADLLKRARSWRKRDIAVIEIGRHGRQGK